MPQSRETLKLMEGLTLTAAPFIVTIYGDVVVPRGEVLSMASLIDICDRAGLSENLVRTAVSRLVKAGRLEGERTGRHSFYRLAPAARAEFAQAAELLYASSFESCQWLVVLLPGAADDTIKGFRMARLAGDAWVCPDRGRVPPGAKMALRAAAVDAPSYRLLAKCWDLNAVGEGYRQMQTRFAPLLARVNKGKRLAPEDALMARVLLVHLYRAPLLRDPCLPAASMPAGWPGPAARALFCELYRALSPDAERHIGRALHGEQDLLRAQTPETVARLAAMG